MFIRFFIENTTLNIPDLFVYLNINLNISYMSHTECDDVKF